MLLNADGFCECEEGYHMHPEHGCLSCQYMVPGCTSCSTVYWDSGIPLDNVRMSGPDSTCSQYLTCDSCRLTQRYVRLDLQTSIAIDGFDYGSADFSNLPDTVKAQAPVKCESCLTAYDGCSSCGTYGDSCTNCM